MLLKLNASKKDTSSQDFNSVLAGVDKDSSTFAYKVHTDVETAYRMSTDWTRTNENTCENKAVTPLHKMDKPFLLQILQFI